MFFLSKLVGNGEAEHFATKTWPTHGRFLRKMVPTSVQSSCLKIRPRKPENQKTKKPKTNVLCCGIEAAISTPTVSTPDRSCTCGVTFRMRFVPAPISDTVLFFSAWNVILPAFLLRASTRQLKARLLYAPQKGLKGPNTPAMPMRWAYAVLCQTAKFSLALVPYVVTEGCSVRCATGVLITHLLCTLSHHLPRQAWMYQRVRV